MESTPNEDTHFDNPPFVDEIQDDDDDEIQDDDDCDFIEDEFEHITNVSDAPVHIESDLTFNELNLLLLNWIQQNHVSQKAVNQLMKILKHCVPSCLFPRSYNSIIQNITKPIQHLLMKKYYVCCGTADIVNKCKKCNATISKPSFFARDVCWVYLLTLLVISGVGS